MFVSCVCCVLCRQRTVRRADHSLRGVNHACVYQLCETQIPQQWGGLGPSGAVLSQKKKKGASSASIYFEITKACIRQLQILTLTDPCCVSFSYMYSETLSYTTKVRVSTLLGSVLQSSHNQILSVSITVQCNLVLYVEFRYQSLTVQSSELINIYIYILHTVQFYIIVSYIQCN